MQNKLHLGKQEYTKINLNIGKIQFQYDLTNIFADSPSHIMTRIQFLNFGAWIMTDTAMLQHESEGHTITKMQELSFGRKEKEWKRENQQKK
jgi:hypothetical protein